MTMNCRECGNRYDEEPADTGACPPCLDRRAAAMLQHEAKAENVRSVVPIIPPPPVKAFLIESEKVGKLFVIAADMGEALVKWRKWIADEQIVGDQRAPDDWTQLWPDAVAEVAGAGEVVR